MLQDEFLIQDLDTLKAISHPLRLDMIRLFKTPQTVKEIAELLEKPPTKLYYHVNLLEKQQILQVIKTNVVSGIIEKTYQVSANRFKVDEALISGPKRDAGNVDVLVGAILDSTKSALKRSVLTQDSDATYPNHNLLHTYYRLTEVEAESFLMQLEVLEDEMARLSEGRKNEPHFKMYNLTTLFFELENEPSTDSE